MWKYPDIYDMWIYVFVYIKKNNAVRALVHSKSWRQSLSSWCHTKFSPLNDTLVHKKYIKQRLCFCNNTKIALTELIGGIRKQFGKLQGEPETKETIKKAEEISLPFI